MPQKRPSFLERLTGSVHDDDQYEEYGHVDGQYHGHYGAQQKIAAQQPEPQSAHDWLGDDEEDGQLAVDVFQTPDEIIVRSIVAGIDPSSLDISISRDMVVVKGSREEERECGDEDYFHKELYWGSFSRSVLLPAEIEVEEARATSAHGLLTIRLPKIDKEKQRKIKVVNGK